MTDPMRRANDLLARMTLDEKVLQVTSVVPIGLLGTDGVDEGKLADRLGNGIGYVSSVAGYGLMPPAGIARCVNQVQRFLVEKTRLGIPAIFLTEALNGILARGFTVFPTAIGLAATWDPDAIELMAAVIGRQMRVIGLGQALSPVLDVARDARWGRVHETYGEDPYLAAAMGVAYVRGLQGEGVIATGKHFLGYGATEGGQNMAATTVGPRELYEVYARPFEAAIKLAGLGAVMNSYSEYDGVPVGASYEILTRLLRGRLGFTGTVVADYMTVEWLHARQQVAASRQGAGVMALAAGLDVELPTAAGYGPTLADAVRTGKVSEEVLDRSVLRVLRDKFALGLFDRPYLAEDPVVIRRAATEGAGLAGELARKSVTLLKNDDGVLPLRRGTAAIAIVGPHAGDLAAAFPTYTYPAMREMVVSRAASAAVPGTEQVLDGPPPAALVAEIRAAAAQDTDGWLRAEYGVISLAEALGEALPDAVITAVPATGVTGDGPGAIAAAVAAARDADVVILALGGRAGWFPEGITEGEGNDSADIDLPAAQVALVKAVAATGTPAVGVIATGRPFAIRAVADDLAAIVWTYYGGQEGSRAVAGALAGTFNPGGKLPYSIPRHTGQVPVYHAQKVGSGYRRTAGDMHHGYLGLPATPQYAFGHGLSYTTFGYGDLAITPPAVPAGGAVTVGVPVTNTGTRPGDEVIQLYIHDTATGLTRPAQQLAGFKRVHLAPGASTTVEFTIQLSQLGYLGLDGDDVILEPGPIEVLAGSASDDIRARGGFDVTGSTTIVHSPRSYLSQARERSS